MKTMWLPKYCACGIALVVCSGTLVEAQTTTRVSVATGGAQATGGGSLASLFADVSDDGRYVAFTSTATNLVAGDTNGVQDIFVHDRQTGSTTRVSVGPGGAQANGASAGQSISGDGRFVSFQSAATNLVAGDTNGLADCFVHDRQTGVTTRVSVATGGAQATGGSNFITAISANGRFVAFYSSATNLVAGDTNGLQDVFRHDRQTGTTIRVNVATGGAQAVGQGSVGPFISTDGRFVGFYTGAANLVPGDTNGVSDVFVHDVQTATTSRVSVGPGGTQANGESLVGSFSNDGRFVCFESSATNLEPGGGIGAFIYDRQTGVTSPVAVVPASAPTQKPTEPKISGNGRFVIFGTTAALVADDTNGQGDVYLRDLQTSATTRVSVATGGGQGNAFSGTGAINENGTVIAVSVVFDESRERRYQCGVGHLRPEHSCEWQWHASDDDARQNVTAVRGSNKRRGVSGADSSASRAVDTERFWHGDLDGDIEPAVAAGESGLRHRFGKPVSQCRLGWRSGARRDGERSDHAGVHGRFRRSGADQRRADACMRTGRRQIRSATSTRRRTT